MVGFVKNSIPFLDKSDILCMPSTWEGFGLVAVEAHVLWKPVVYSNAGGLPMIVDDECGRACRDANYAREYAKVIERILDNKSLYNHMSDAANNKAEHMSNINDFSEGIKRVYQEVIDHS